MFGKTKVKPVLGFTFLWWGVAGLAAVVVASVLFVRPETARAAVGINKQISFQGKVTNPNGTNVSNGTYSFVFKLYTVSSAGSAVWTETDNLTVTDGIFQVNLGATTALPGSIDFNTDNIYLGITFNSDPAGEMTPRVQLTASPYAFNADKLDGLDASQLVQLSPGAQQTGSINISGTAQFGGAITAPTSTDTINGLVINAGNLTAVTGITTSGGYVQSGSTANTLTGATTISATGTALTLSGAATTGINFSNTGITTDLNLQNGETIDNNVDGIIKVNAVLQGGFGAASTSGTLDWDDATNTTSGSGPTLLLGTATSGSGDANYYHPFNFEYSTKNGNGNVTQLAIPYAYTQGINAGLKMRGRYNGTWSGWVNILSSNTNGNYGIGTSGTPASLLSVGGTTGNFQVNSSGAITAITGYTQASGNMTLSQAAADQFKVQASAAPTSDMAVITNAGQAAVAAGANNLALNFVGGAAAVEAGAMRIDLQPGTTTGGTWNGVRFVANATGPATGVTETALKVEGPTTGGAGTFNGLNIANIGAVTTGGTARGISITGTNSQTAGTIRGIQLNNLTAGAASEIGIDLGTGWDNLLTYNNGATVLINGSGQWNLAQVTGTLGVSNGGTGQTTTQAAINSLSQLTTNGDLLYHNGTNSTRLARGTNGQCLTSNATTLLWGSCGTNGVTTVGTFSASGQTNGATISSTTITFGPATASLPGMVSTGSQTFGGDKTFTSTAPNTSDGASIRVTSSATSTTNPQNGIYSLVTASPASASTQVVSGVQGGTYSTSANVSGASLFGVYGQGSWGGATQTNTVAGGYFYGQHQGTGTADLIAGAIVEVQEIGTGTITNARGLSVRAAAGSAITNNYGIYVEDQTAGTTADYGLYVAGADTRGIYVAADGITIAGGGLTVTGNSTITGTLGSLTGLTSSGTIQFSALTTNGYVKTGSGNGTLSVSTSIPASDLSGQVAVANGGTGQTTTQAAINSLSQLTTNGDILYHNGTNSTRLARGTNGQCLTSNATTILWSACGGGITTVGTFSASGQTDGATISGSTITFGPATASLPGMVSTGTQTFGGDKSFTGNVSITNSSNGQLYLNTTGATQTSIAFSNAGNQKWIMGNQGSGGYDFFLFDLVGGSNVLNAISNNGTLTVGNSARPVTIDGSSMSVVPAASFQSSVAVTGLLSTISTAADTEILKFDTERPWSFFQRSTGASTRLDLRSSTGSKNFTITNTSGEEIADFFASDSATAANQVSFVEDRVVINDAGNLNLSAGLLQTGGTTRLTNTGGLQAITGFAQTSGNHTISQNAADVFSITAAAAPTTDMASITNAGQAVTTAGVNNLALNFVGGAAAVESSSLRINLQPGTTTGGQWSGLRFIASATGPATGVIENGTKLEGPTTGGAGTYNALNVANLAVASGGTARGLYVTATNSQAAGTIRGIQVANITAGAASETAIDLGTGWDNLLTYNNGATVLVDGTGQFNLSQVFGALAADNGGTGQTSYAVGDLLYANSTSTLARLADVAAGSCLTSGGVGVAPAWGSCDNTTLQTAYAAGNTVTTTDARNLLFTLANTTTDSNFLVNIATGSTSDFAVQGNGTDIFSVSTSAVNTTLGHVQTGTGANTFSGATTFSGSGTGLTVNNAALISGTLTVNTVVTSNNTNLTITPTGSGDLVLNTDADTNMQINASAAPTADQLAITNTGRPVLTAGVNNLSLNFVGGAAAVEAGAMRIDLQPGTTTGGTWNGYRFVHNATGPATGVTTSGSKFEGPTTGGAGTYNAVNIANIGAVTTNGIVRGINITATNSQAAGTVRGLQVNNITAGAASEIAVDLGTGWDNLLTYNNGATVLINGSGQWNLAQVTGTLAAANGGTGQSSYAVGDILYASTTSALSRLADVATGSCLRSGGVGVAPSWGSCTAAGDVTTVASFSASGQTNGATISGNSITFGPATASLPGMVSTGSQTWAGAKAFNDNVTLGDASGDTLTINGTAISAPNNLNFDSNTLFVDSTNDRVGVGITNGSFKLTINSTAANDGLQVLGSSNRWISNLVNMGAANYNGLVQANDQGIIYGGASVGTATGLTIAPWSSTTGGIRLDGSGNTTISGTLAVTDVSTFSAKLKPAFNATYSVTSDVITTHETTNTPGENMSDIVIGADGLPLLVYFETTAGDLKARKCANVACTSSVVNTIDAGGNGADSDKGQTTVAISSDGLPNIVWYESTNDELKYVKCTTANCSSVGASIVLDTVNDAGIFNSIIIPADGLPFIAYQNVNGSSFALKTIKCGNATCTSGNTTTTVDTSSGAGRTVDAEIAADGYPIMVEVINGNTAKVVKCSNAACSSSTSTTPDTTIGDNTAMVVPADGNPVLFYRDSNQTATFIKCGNSTCSSGNTLTNTGVGQPAYNTDIEIAGDGLPVAVSYDYGAGFDLHVHKCTNSSCTSSVHNTPETLGNVGKYPKMAIGTDGLPIIVYDYDTSDDLRTLHCGSQYCDGSTTYTKATDGVSIGSTTEIFDSLYVESINANLAGAKFKLDSSGNLTISATTTGSTQRLCHSGSDGATSGLVLGDCAASGQADLAEMYDTNGTLEPGDVVAPAGGYKVDKTKGAYDGAAIGVVSTNPTADGIIGYNVKSETRQPIALAGRIPVKVSLENGPVKVGDKLTSASTPGFAMKATNTGRVIGVALEAYTDASPRVSDLVAAEEAGRASAHKTDLAPYVSNPSKWPANSGKIMMFADVNFYSASASDVLLGQAADGDQILNGTLTVAGGLTVNGTATFNGLVSVNTLTVTGEATFAQITVNGHIVTGGDAPTIVIGEAAGQAPVALASVTGNDTSGTLTVNTGAQAKDGIVATVTFKKPFGKSPKVMLTPGNADAANIKIFREATKESFVIKSTDTLQTGKAYTFDYFVVE